VIQQNSILEDFKSIQKQQYGNNSSVPGFLGLKQKPSYWGLFYRQLFPGDTNRQTLLK